MPTKDRNRQQASNRKSHAKHRAARLQAMKDYRLRNKRSAINVSDEELDRRALEMMGRAA